MYNGIFNIVPVIVFILILYGYINAEAWRIVYVCSPGTPASRKSLVSKDLRHRGGGFCVVSTWKQRTYVTQVQTWHVPMIW